MNAEEARRITQENLRGPAIEHFLRALDHKILEMAKCGKSSFDPWGYLASLRTPGPTTDERGAIRRHYVAAGYTFQDHPDPDPGHPCSRPYTTLSW